MGVEDMILPLLREMRAEIGELKAENRAGFADVKVRLEKLERSHQGLRHAFQGESFMTATTFGEVEGRLNDIDARLSKIEERAGS